MEYNATMPLRYAGELKIFKACFNFFSCFALGNGTVQNLLFESFDTLYAKANIGNEEEFGKMLVSIFVGNLTLCKHVTESHVVRILDLLSKVNIKAPSLITALKSFVVINDGMTLQPILRKQMLVVKSISERRKLILDPAFLDDEENLEFKDLRFDLVSSGSDCNGNPWPLPAYGQYLGPNNGGYLWTEEQLRYNISLVDLLANCAVGAKKYVESVLQSTISLSQLIMLLNENNTALIHKSPYISFLNNVYLNCSKSTFDRLNIKETILKDHDFWRFLARYVVDYISPRLAMLTFELKKNECLPSWEQDLMFNALFPFMRTFFSKIYDISALENYVSASKLENRHLLSYEEFFINHKLNYNDEYYVNPFSVIQALFIVFAKFSHALKADSAEFNVLECEKYFSEMDASKLPSIRNVAINFAVYDDFAAVYTDSIKKAKMKVVVPQPNDLAGLSASKLKEGHDNVFKFDDAFFRNMINTTFQAVFSVMKNKPQRGKNGFKVDSTSYTEMDHVSGNGPLWVWPNVKTVAELYSGVSNCKESGDASICDHGRERSSCTGAFFDGVSKDMKALLLRLYEKEYQMEIDVNVDLNRTASNYKTNYFGENSIACQLKSKGCNLKNLEREPYNVAKSSDMHSSIDKKKNTRLLDADREHSMFLLSGAEFQMFIRSFASYDVENAAPRIKYVSFEINSLLNFLADYPKFMATITHGVYAHSSAASDHTILAVKVLKVVRGLLHNEMILEGDITYCQNALSELGILSAIIPLVSAHDNALSAEAFNCLSILLETYNPYVQQKFLQYMSLNKESSVAFFLKLVEKISNAQKLIIQDREMVNLEHEEVQMKKPANDDTYFTYNPRDSTTSHPALGDVNSGTKNHPSMKKKKEEVVSGAVGQFGEIKAESDPSDITQILKIFQMLCEGHVEKIQNLLCSRGKSNIAVHTAGYFEILISKVTPENVNQCCQGLDSLIDMAQDHSGIQKLLVEAHIVQSINLILCAHFHKDIKIDKVIELKNKAVILLASFLELQYPETRELAQVLWKNLNHYGLYESLIFALIFAGKASKLKKFGSNAVSIGSNTAFIDHYNWYAEVHWVNEALPKSFEPSKDKEYVKDVETSAFALIISIMSVIRKLHDFTHSFNDDPHVEISKHFLSHLGEAVENLSIDEEHISSENKVFRTLMKKTYANVLTENYLRLLMNYVYPLVRSIEILRLDVVHKIYFPFNEELRLNEAVKMMLKMEGDLSSPGSKIKFFHEIALKIIKDLVYVAAQQKISSTGHLFDKMLDLKDFFTSAVFFFTGLINLLILATWEANVDFNVVKPDVPEWYQAALWALGGCHIFFSLLLVLSFMLKNPWKLVWPSLWTQWTLEFFRRRWLVKMGRKFFHARITLSKRLEVLADSRAAHLASEVKDGIELLKKFSRANSMLSEEPIVVVTDLQKKTWWAYFWQMMYFAVFVALSIWGIFNHGYTYGFHMFHIVKEVDILKRAVESVNRNINALAMVSLLLVAILYVYAVTVFIFAREFVDRNDGIFCDTLGRCFLTSLNYGLRAGLGDTIHPSYVFGFARPGIWFLFEMSVFIVINIIGLNVVLGIIVDAFDSLREKDRKQVENLSQECFICSRSRAEFEIAEGFGYADHIKLDHNMYNYIYFLHYLKAKDMTEQTGHELFVTSELKKNSTSFYPMSKALVLQEGESELYTKLDGLHTRLTEVNEFLGRKTG